MRRLVWILLKERVRKKERNTNLFFQPLNPVQLPELQLQRQLTVIDAFVLTLFCDHVFFYVSLYGFHDVSK